MQHSTMQLLADLTHRTQENLQAAEAFEKIPEEHLNKKPTAKSWSALECLEHLNRYGDFYLPEINKRLDDAPRAETETFKSGWLGNKFAKMMLPGAKSMNTFAAMNPANSTRTKADLEKFIAQQKQMLQLLARCADYNLSKIKTSITISNLIKLRLGDTLRVVIYHNQRHLEQAKRALK